MLACRAAARRPQLLWPSMAARRAISLGPRRQHRTKHRGQLRCYGRKNSNCIQCCAPIFGGLWYRHEDPAGSGFRNCLECSGIVRKTHTLGCRQGPDKDNKKKKTGKDGKAAAAKGKKGKATAKKGKTSAAKGKKNNSATNSNAKKASGKGKSKYVVQAKTTKKKG